MDPALFGALFTLLGVLSTLAVTLWRGRRVDARDAREAENRRRAEVRTERHAVLDHLRELLKLEGERRDAAEARATAAAEAATNEKIRYHEEMSVSGAAKMALADEREQRLACERAREALASRMTVLEEEVGRLRDESENLHGLVNRLVEDLGDIRHRIRICVDTCDHRPACGLVHVAA